MKIASTSSDSIVAAVATMKEKVGDLFAAVRDVESIKVYSFDKRVRLIFEPRTQDEEAMHYIVRYADQTLNNRERRLFEQRLREQYTLTVLSTEKRYARR